MVFYSAVPELGECARNEFSGVPFLPLPVIILAAREGKEIPCPLSVIILTAREGKEILCPLSVSILTAREGKDILCVLECRAVDPFFFYLDYFLSK